MSANGHRAASTRVNIGSVVGEVQFGDRITYNNGNFTHYTTGVDSESDENVSTSEESENQSTDNEDERSNDESLDLDGREDISNQHGREESNIRQSTGQCSNSNNANNDNRESTRIRSNIEDDGRNVTGSNGNFKNVGIVDGSNPSHNDTASAKLSSEINDGKRNSNESVSNGSTSNEDTTQVQITNLSQEVTPNKNTINNNSNLPEASTETNVSNGRQNLFRLIVDMSNGTINRLGIEMNYGHAAVGIVLASAVTLVVKKYFL